jgi:Ion transport protein
MLIFTAFVSPYRIAFVDVDSKPWQGIETFTDCIFGLDLILNFFFAYYDQSEEIIDNRTKIAIDYLKGWFTIDLITVFPISQILSTGNFGHLAKVARIPRLYRLIKIIR